MNDHNELTRRETLVSLGVGSAASLVLPLAAAAVQETAGRGKTLTLNPYERVDWQRVGRYKAALHLHTLQSDGYHPVQEVVGAYQKAGYTIVSITDHDWNWPNARVTWKELPPEKASPYPAEPHPDNYPANPTWPWPDYGCAAPEALGLVGIQGNELTFRHHINSYFSDYGVWYERTGDRAPYGGIVDARGKEIWEDDQLKAIQDKGGLAVINHPGIPSANVWWERKPLEWYVARYRMHPAGTLVGIEVANCVPGCQAYDEGLWDQLLARFMPHRPIWGFGTDDMHKLTDVKHAFTVFFLDAATVSDVRQAMLSGHFCFCASTRRMNYQGDASDADVFPKLREVSVDPEAGRITIRADACDEIRWISAPESLDPVEDYKTSNQPWPMGRVVHVGETLSYRTTPAVGTYVRAELHRRAGGHLYRTFTNPFGFCEQGIGG